jgi:predicted short-subunit dehydrogenase-like oxidoreductase (DUF2520 family)
LNNLPARKDLKVKRNLNIAIIGAGRLGTALGFYIASKKINNIKIAAITARTDSTLSKVKEVMGRHGRGILFTLNNNEAVREANCIFICTPDDLISKTCETIYKSIKNHKKERVVIHFSGAKSLKEIEVAAKIGDHIASMHPLKSFASTQQAIETIENTEYGVTYTDREGREATGILVGALKGESIFIDDDKKPVYHAAACMASNYIVTLMDCAVYMNEKIGIRSEDAIKGLTKLAEGTIKNIKNLGTKKSLTGPIARGDNRTLEEHLRLLKNIMSDKDVQIYRIMGLRTAFIARENGWIDGETYQKMQDILTGK